MLTLVFNIILLEQHLKRPQAQVGDSWIDLVLSPQLTSQTFVIARFIYQNESRIQRRLQIITLSAHLLLAFSAAYSTFSALHNDNNYLTFTGVHGRLL
jgi:hypothetical protein